MIDSAAEIETGSLKRAIEIAAEAHLGQVDKGDMVMTNALIEGSETRMSEHETDMIKLIAQIAKDIHWLRQPSATGRNSKMILSS